MMSYDVWLTAFQSLHDAETDLTVDEEDFDAELRALYSAGLDPEVAVATFIKLNEEYEPS